MQPAGTIATQLSNSPLSLGIRTLPEAMTRTSVTKLLPLRPLPSRPPLQTRAWGSPHSRGVRILTRSAVRKSVPCEAWLGSRPSYRRVPRPGPLLSRQPGLLLPWR